MSVIKVNKTLPDYPTLIHFAVFFSTVKVLFQSHLPPKVIHLTIFPGRARVTLNLFLILGE